MDMSKTDMNMGNGSQANMMDMMNMKMFFHFQKQVTVLFKEWNVSSTGGLVGTCVAMLVLAVLYEGLKQWRGSLIRKHSTKEQSTRRIFNCFHVSQTLLNMLQVLMGYLLMLVVMTYNAWLGLAVVLGIGLGYFIMVAIFGVISVPRIQPESNKKASLKMLYMRPLDKRSDSSRENAGQQTRDTQGTTGDYSVEVKLGEENPDSEIPGRKNSAFEADNAAE